MSKTYKAILIVLVVLIVDQVSKILIKTQMSLGEYNCILGNCDEDGGGWFMIRYIENPGMAFGWDIPGKFGKIALSLFRIVAIGGIIWYLRNLIQTNAKTLLIVSVSMILAGAIGNILDSTFYGLIFDTGTSYIAEYDNWMGYGGVSKIDFSGYSGVFRGCVVDMLYFPLFDGSFPEWVPFKGGQDFVFFRPIFNIADSAISIGVMLILLFQRKLFKHL